MALAPALQSLKLITNNNSEITIPLSLHILLSSLTHLLHTAFISQHSYSALHSAFFLCHLLPRREQTKYPIWLTKRNWEHSPQKLIILLNLSVRSVNWVSRGFFTKWAVGFKLLSEYQRKLFSILLQLSLICEHLQDLSSALQNNIIRAALHEGKMFVG